MARIRCMWGPDDCRWYGLNYEDRHLIKRLPTRDRAWSNVLHCWITPTHVLATLPRWLEDAGYTVAIVDVTRHIPTRNWHAEYRRVLGRPCPHKTKTAAATATELPLGKAA